jgi:hypothetical protein
VVFCADVTFKFFRHHHFRLDGGSAAREAATLRSIREPNGA